MALRDYEDDRSAHSQDEIAATVNDALASRYSGRGAVDLPGLDLAGGDAAEVGPTHAWLARVIALGRRR